jgi:valyl-tRNA synthetase
MEKNYNPKDIEPKITKFWEENKLFKFDRSSSKPSFCIDTPPPFTSGVPHMGHALWWTWNDVVARYKRMRGFNVLLPQGWDCHGLPTELKVEKNFKVKKSDKEKFLEACKMWTDDMIKKMKVKMIEMGYSSDWDFEYSTDSKEYIAFAQKTLLNLFYRSLLKRVDHPMMWCTKCGTTLAKAEVGYKEKEGILYDIKLPVEDDHIIISTTRPEFMPACVAVFVHPEDARYKRYTGKKVKLPIFGREVPILSNEDVDMSFGTGVVYLCTYGDEADIRWQKKYNLPAIIIINEYGKMNENAEILNGLSLKDARERILQELAKLGLLVKETKFKHNVLVHTERGDCLNPIEFLIKKQWAIETVKFSDKVLEMANSMEWYPDFMKKRLENWTNSMDWDWIISRQRVYGTPIPFWYCEKCEQIFAPKPEELPVNPSIQTYKKDKCDCGGRILGETDICDGWIDSSISPLIISGYWKGDDELFKKLYPNSMRQQGNDIIRTWAYYTMLRCYLETGIKPWKSVLINNMILGPDGREMHKSVGNVVLPDEVLSKQGADTIRSGLIMMGVLGNDVAFAWKDMNFTFKFLTKLWNIFRFSSETLDKTKNKQLTLMDFWILTKLQNVIEKVTKSYEEFQFTEAFETLHTFIWHDIADNYLEMVKYRIFENKAKESVVTTLYDLLITVTKLLAPITPFLTEELWQEFFRDREKVISVHSSDWPTANASLTDSDALEMGDMAVAMISSIRQYKNKRGIALNAPIEQLTIECDEKYRKRLERVFEDIKGTIKVKEIIFGQGEIVIENFPLKISVKI